MSEKSFDDVNFDKLVSVNSNLIDETKPTARFFELRSAHRDCPLICALSDAFPAVFVEDAHGCEPTYWNVGGHYRNPATMPEMVLRWYVLRALRKDTGADPAEYIDDYEMFASTTALCKKLIEELEYNHGYNASVVCDPETGEFLFDYADPDFYADHDFGEDVPETVVAVREKILSKLRDKGYKFNSYSELFDYVEQLDERSYSPLDEDTLDPEEQDFLQLDELKYVIDDIYAQRIHYNEHVERLAEISDESGNNSYAQREDDHDELIAKLCDALINN